MSVVKIFKHAELKNLNLNLLFSFFFPTILSPQLSIVKNNSTIDIMKTFEASNMAAIEELHKFSFVPKSLDKKGDRRSIYGTSAEPTPPPSAPVSLIICG